MEKLFKNFEKKHSRYLLDEKNYNKINLLFEKWDMDLIKNRRINVKEISSSFVDENKNLMVNYPHGEIVSYDLTNGNIEWRIPFGYKNGKNLEWVKNHSYQEQSLNWYQSSTLPTTNIHFIYLAPAIPKR